MKIEDQVCSLELAKDLKTLGIKQVGFYSWQLNKGDIPVPTLNISFMGEIDCDAYCAFTVSELTELLPAFVDDKSLTLFRCNRNGWWCEYQDGKGGNYGVEYWDKSLPNVMSKMLIHLTKQGIYKP